MAEAKNETRASPLVSELWTDVEIKASADKFHHMFAKQPHHVSKAAPGHITRVELHEGDWDKVSSIVLWTYVHGVPDPPSTQTRRVDLDTDVLPLNHATIHMARTRIPKAMITITWKVKPMRVMYEPWFVKNKVDVVFAGHVHAYERSERISNLAYNVVNGICSPVKDQSAPVYITIGDGGNLEGLATNMTEPQPEYSAFREASFGHAVLSIKNRTHAYYGWHRNHGGSAVQADSMWFYN